MDSPQPLTPNLVPGGAPRKVLLDARGRVYEPAIGPRLKVVLAFIFAAVALLGATGVYLMAIRYYGLARGQEYTNQFTLWMFIAHVAVGVLLVLPFLLFGLVHYSSARKRKNRLAVRLGVVLFIVGLLV